jgi:hypothetical protein
MGRQEIKFSDATYLPSGEPGKTFQLGPGTLIYETKAIDTQIGGQHYKKLGTAEPWKIVDAAFTAEAAAGFYRGNALKYLLRNKSDAVEDLKKARHYLDRLIEVLS